MADEHPPRRGTAHPAIDLTIGLLTLAWLGGTIGFMVLAIDVRLCVGSCEIDPHEEMRADRFVLASVGCAIGFPLLTAAICGLSGRKIAAILFVLGLLLGVVYGGMAGIGIVREMRRLDVHAPAPLPANSCPCYSGGGCDCPGG